MNFNIDIAIVVGFLIVNLCVGLRYGRGVRTIKSQLVHFNFESFPFPLY